MHFRLREVAALLGFAAAMAFVAQPARADQQKTAEDLQVSWEGQGEIQLAPADDGEFSLSLRLIGKVVVRGEKLEARADGLTCNMAKKVVVLESTSKDGVQLSFQVPDGGPVLRLVARRILISLSDGRIKVDGAGRLSTPAKEPPKPVAQADVP
jgi:hypothetical protein